MDDARLAHAFLHPDGLAELRTVPPGPRLSGVYTDSAAMLADTARIGGNVFWTVNEFSGLPVTNAITSARAGGCVGDKHVSRIRNLFVDVDSVRPDKHQPATEAERLAAREVMDRLIVYLRSHGFPDPLLIDSGNGFHAFWPTSLSPELAPLVDSLLEHLDGGFTTAGAKVDRSVSNPARIVRVPGTKNTKGQATEERPHRTAHIISIPVERVEVTAEQILALVPAVPQSQANAVAVADSQETIERVTAWLTTRGVAFDLQKHNDGTHYFRLRECPWKPGHTDGNAYVGVNARGIFGGCFHASCAGKKFRALAKAIGGWQDEGNPTDPHRLAERHMERFAHDGRPTSLHIDEEFLIWNGSLWLPMSDRAMAPHMTATAKAVVDESGESKAITRKMVGDALAALHSISRWETPQAPPCWREPHECPADEVIPFDNGLLLLPRYLAGEPDSFIPATPKFFNRHKLAFAFDPEAPEPKRWLQFLGELWDDPACHDLVHEWGGYCMTYDTSLQKMMMLIGETRAGKGTLCWLWGQMVGGNFASPTFKSLLGEFGLAPLLGRQLALFPDSKMMSPKVLEEVCAILKGISGEDPMTINVKHKQQQTAQLRTRIVIPSNDLLAIPDASSALQARQLFLHFSRSFRGQEDTKLKAKLLAELPGIANLFLGGLRRLRENGNRFTEPESSKELARRINRDANPIVAFVDERCAHDASVATPTRAMFDAFSEWAAENGFPQLNDAQFGKQFLDAAKVTKSQNLGGRAVMGPAGVAARPYYYLSIRLV